MPLSSLTQRQYPFPRPRGSNALQDLLGPRPANVFGSLTQALGGGAPQGLTTADLNRLFARAGAGAQAGLQSALGSLARSFGGNVGDPAFQAQASRLRAGAGSRTAGAIADIRFQAGAMRQQAEFQHRGQLAQASGLQATFQNLRNESLQALLQFALGSRQQGFAELMAMRGRSITAQDVARARREQTELGPPAY